MSIIRTGNNLNPPMPPKTKYPNGYVQIDRQIAIIGMVFVPQTEFAIESDTKVSQSITKANGTTYTNHLFFNDPSIVSHPIKPSVFLEMIRHLSDIPRTEIKLIQNIHHHLNNMQIVQGSIIRKADDYLVHVIQENAMGNTNQYQIDLKPLHSNYAQNATFPNAEDYIKVAMQLGGDQYAKGLPSPALKTTHPNMSGMAFPPISGYTEEEEETLPQNDHEIINDIQDVFPLKPGPKLKNVFCPYNCDIVIYDVYNKRVNELCGPLTQYNYYNIMLRSDDNTEFIGLEILEAKAKQLGATESELEQLQNKFNNEFPGIDNTFITPV